MKGNFWNVEFVNLYPIVSLTLYFFNVIFTVVISIVVYYILSYCFPRLARIICGK